jgi:hypothetical protein
VDLAATADARSDFAGWTGGDCAGVTTPTCTVTLSAPQTVRATFDRKPPPTFGLTVSITGDGTVDPPCSDGCRYPAGREVTLTGRPGSTTDHVTWTDCDSTPTLTECVVTMSRDRQVSAEFTLNVPTG